MTILVIGEQGQLAQSLLRAARRKGLPLTAMGRPKLDLRDRASIDRAVDEVKPSIIINAAAYTAVDKAESEPDAAFAINADAVGSLGETCARRGIGIIHISTDYVFDGSKGAPYLETDTAAPLGVYGRSKFAGEEQLRTATDRHVIVRTAWLYSPYGNNFLKTMLRLGAERQELSIVNDQYGNPTYAPHFADALLELSSRAQGSGFEGWGTYHLAGSGEATWYEFAREIFSRASSMGIAVPRLLPMSRTDYPAPAPRPADSRLDCSQMLQWFDLALPRWQIGTRECLERLSEPSQSKSPG